MKKTTAYLSLVWAVSCYVFVGIILVATKLFTNDPNFSGGHETPLLIPMLSSAFVGLASFGLMVLIGLISAVKKDKTVVKMPLGISVLKSTISVVFLGIVTVVFFLGFRNGNLGYKKPNYTGQQLFDEINEYRVSHGKKIIPLELVICDNLVARYLKIKSGDVGHEGFEDWAKNEEIDKKYIPMAEMYIKDSASVKDAIAFWDGSPGHRLTMMGDFDVGCSYANEGTGVVVFGNNLPK